MDSAWISQERQLWDIVQGNQRQRLPSLHGLDRKARAKVLTERERLTAKYNAREWQALDALLKH